MLDENLELIDLLDLAQVADVLPASWLSFPTIIMDVEE